MDVLFPTLFAKVSILLAATMGTACIGTYFGRSIRNGWAVLGLLVLFFFGCFGVLIAANGSPEVGITSLLAWGLVTGLCFGPVFENYAEQLGWQTVFGAFLGTMGAMGICGFIGMFSGIDFSGAGHIASIVLFGLIIVGIVGIFIRMSRQMNIIVSLIGMAVFAVYFLVDFSQLERSDDNWKNAISLTVKIFLDALNFLLHVLKLLAALKGHH